MSHVLVTGVNGFVGKHLVKELFDNNYTITGIGGEQGSREKSSYIDKYLALDLTKPEDARKIDFSRVEGIIHLAGLAAVGPSFDNPQLYIDVNLGIEINLYEEALKQGAKPKFIVVSSGSLYDSKASLPLTEESLVIPNSPYAVSKLGQEQLARYYETRGFECVIARPFNHIGPGQSLGFIVPDLAQQIVSLSNGQQNEIMVGNLDAKRDYTDVRDIVRAYRLLLEKGVTGEIYNICSGKAHSGHEILEGLTKAAVVDPVIKEDPTKMRPSDTPEIYGSNNKLSQATGWQPEIELETTLSDVIASLKI